MSLKKKLEDRYNIVMIVLVIMMGLLIFNLAKLTIVKGEDYRLEADTTRLKKIPITAARGEIRDRNGKLIAGNKPSFTVQILKDELDSKDTKEKNKDILNLIRLLEEDGSGYLDEFPIELNVFKYKDGNKGELDPIDRVVDILIDNSMVEAFLNKYYSHDGYDEHFVYIPAERVLQALRNKGMELPIKIDIRDEVLIYSYEEGYDIDSWKREHSLDINASPLEDILALIEGNRTIVRDLLTHPISREIAYDLMLAWGVEDNIIVEDYSLSYDDEFLEQKHKLMENFHYVTEKTSAEEDFLNIFKEISLENFLRRTRQTTNVFGREKIGAYGEDLIRLVQKEDRNFRMKVEIDEENDYVEYIYMGPVEAKADSDLEILISTAEGLGVLDEFLKDDDIRGAAQGQLLKDGVNTKISVTDGYEYAFINNKKILYENNKIDMDSKAEDAFEKLRERAKIDKKLSKYEARAILAINHVLRTQGYLAYRPINIAYGIKDTTVARIKEGMSDVSGINVSIEPIRYYPEGETAAHILGYLGRISQENEIETYVNERGYSKNDIIGKTGIEQSFEENLRGENGVKTVEIDVLGNTTRSIDEQKPKPGDNIYLSIDLDVQKKAEEALKYTLETIQKGGVYESQWGNYSMATNRKAGRPYKNATSGATVAVDVKTGEVIAMASYPAYDPNLFSTGISSSDWKSLFPENEKDPLAPRPLYNVATQTAVQQGSTYKMATALAGLEQGLSPYKKIMDRGYVAIGDKKFGCYLWNNGGGSHGAVDVFKALEDSCNYYFYSLILGMDQRGNQSIGVKVDIEDLAEISTKLGMNDKTGIEINIPSETHGGVPNPSIKEQATKNMLKNFLRRNLNNYLDQPLGQEDLEEKVEIIASWIDLDEIPTKNQLLKLLEEIGIDGERKLEANGDDLADIIKYTYLNQAGWNVVDTLNASIGQGHGEYTAIQMANFVSTISNGGYKNKLTLIDNIKNYNNSEVKFSSELDTERIELNNYENLEYVKEGMRLVSKSGTARRTFQNFPVEVATKTGTAEKAGKNPVTGESYDNFASFVAFAPYDDPEIAVATIILQGGSGGNAGPMTRDIIAEYLGLNYEEDKDELPFKNTLVK